MKTRLPLLFAAMVSLGIPYATHGQAPNLGSAINFTLFTADGAFDNTGLTWINGDIGTHTALVSGFPIGVVTGSIHEQNATTAQAAMDVDLAYNAMTSVVCANILGPGLGNGQSLNAGVFCILSAATISGDLILDGQGIPTATFIIKVDGTLDVDPGARILLTNSAVECNVYWQVNGAFAVGIAAEFQGKLIANGSITMLDASTLTGNVLAKAGAITIHNINATTCTPIVLDGDLLALTANLDDALSGIELHWEASQGPEPAQFQIQRSADATHFETLATVPSSSNTASPFESYTFTDQNPIAGNNYYRIAVMDGAAPRFTSSIVMTTFAPQKQLAKVYPNPFTDELNVQILLPNDETNGRIEIYDTQGKLVLGAPIADHKMRLSTPSMVSGLYGYKIWIDDRLLQTGTLIQH